MLIVMLVFFFLSELEPTEFTRFIFKNNFYDNINMKLFFNNSN